MTEVATQNAISLKGSAALITEFFYFGLNSILYQRGLYPSESFNREKKYGLTLLVTQDKKLKAFLEPLFEQVQFWLSKKNLKKLVVVISKVKTKETLERWQFDIETENIEESGANSTRNKDEKKIRQEMGDVLRQITASVSFLPMLEEECSFDVLSYTGKDVEMKNADWTNSGACLIENAETVSFRQCSTGVHTVKSNVQYKMDD